MADSLDIKLIDSHCHLDYLERDGQQLSHIIKEAKAEGVGHFITIGTKWDQRHIQKDIADRFDEVYCSIGTHPHEAEPQILPSIDEFICATEHEKTIAIGETGLDFYYNHSPKEPQIKAFVRHIEVARLTGLPLVIHCRNADEEMCEILNQEQAKGKFKGVIHCFSGTKQLADTAIEHDMMISISGIITFKKSDELRAIIDRIPLSHLIVETDSPYLAPHPYRGKTNQPKFVATTANFLADMKEIPLSQLAQITTENCQTLFNKAKFFHF